MESVEDFGSALLVTEEKFEGLNIKQVTADNLDEINGKFDCVIVNLNESIRNESAEKVSRKFIDIFDRVKVGGLIFIPNTTYEFLPNGRLGAEALMKLLDFTLEMPMHKLTKMIVASKELGY